MPRWLQLTLLIAGYALTVGVGYYIWSTRYDAISAWAVSLTGAVVLWYTWETMQLRQAAYREREGQLRPFIVFQRSDQHYEIVNVGHGTALNINIETLVVSSEFELEIRFPHAVAYLKPNASVEFKTESYLKGNRSDENWLASIDPKYVKRNLDIKIHFSNIEGRKYSLVQTVAPGTVEIQGFRNEAL